MALGLTLVMTAGFLLLFRQARQSLRLEPELASMRQVGRAALDRIAADLLRAGSGLPVEVPIFSDLAPAGDRNPDGLDFLAAPERLAEAAFEPVVAFDGATATLALPNSRLAGSAGSSGGSWVVVFNDDEMTPRWVFGRVRSVSGGGGAGARVRIAPSQDPRRRHFRAAADAGTFEPGSGGGLLERGLRSLLGGAIKAALPGFGNTVVSGLTEQVVTSVIETMTGKKKGEEPDGGGGGADPGGADPGGADSAGSGLFGLGQPGIVPVSRIRYWVRPAPADAADGRAVLMRRVDEAPPQPVGFVEDLQVRYVTGGGNEVLADIPPPFAGDMRSAAHLGGRIARAVEVSVRVRSVGRRLAGSSGPGPGAGAGDFLSRTYRRRVGLRVAAAGVERRAWEERMQWSALPTDIPKIGPLRFVRLPW